MLIGLISAIESEFALIETAIKDVERKELHGRVFLKGTIKGKELVAVRSGIGKVASATTAAILIDSFKCTCIVFVGVAGGLRGRVKIGDIVISDCTAQHDFDGRPWVERHVVFSVKQVEIPADEKLVERAKAAVTHVLSEDFARINESGMLKETPSMHVGMIVSGDQFISSLEQADDIAKRLPKALCVEMEGGAVGQVCYEFGIPYVDIRAISDSGEGEASVEFEKFTSTITSPMMLAITEAFLSIDDCPEKK